jgi:putative selenium metabolism hydrolase
MTTPDRMSFTNVESAMSAKDFVLRLLAVHSYSTQESDVAAVFAAELTALGFQVEHDDWGNVIGTLKLGPGPTVLLDGHLDTVEVQEPKHWMHHPFGEIYEGRIYGRGSVDMKGPLAACVYGAAFIAKENKHYGTIVISGSVCEELAEGPALTHVIERLGRPPESVVICEPSGNQLMLGQRGRAEICIEVHGTPCHSAFPEAGVNAAEVMAELIVALRDLPLPAQPELGPGILALTDLKSFPYPSQSMIPNRCVATFDRRTLTGEEAEDVVSALRQVAKYVADRNNAVAHVSLAQAKFTTHTGVDVERDVFAPAWLTPADSPVAVAAATGLQKAGLGSNVGYYKFCTNGSASAGQLSLPTLGYGPGDSDQAHTIDESISIADLNRGVHGYAAILGAMLCAEKPKTVAPTGDRPKYNESDLP